MYGKLNYGYIKDSEYVIECESLDELIQKLEEMDLILLERPRFWAFSFYMIRLVLKIDNSSKGIKEFKQRMKGLWGHISKEHVHAFRIHQASYLRDSYTQLQEKTRSDMEQVKKGYIDLEFSTTFDWAEELNGAD